MRRIALISALVIVAGASSAPTVSARSLTIERFDAVISIGESGSILVTETIRPRFSGSWNGIYRTIPVRYRTTRGFNYSIKVFGIEITNDNGRTLEFETDRQGDYLKIKIWVPNAHDATRTVKLSYAVKNALRFFDDHDELYWNVTGDEWEVPIESATAKISLPLDVTGLKAAAFTGAYGSRASNAEVEIGSYTATFATTARLSFREGLTAVVGWDKGFVREPTALDRAEMFLAANWPLFIPFVVFPWMYWMWYTRGRDPRLRPITVRYEPPDGLTVAEVGTLIDNSPDMRDITATMIDLAVRGYLVIEETKEDSFLGLMTNHNYMFSIGEKKPDEWKNLESYEWTILTALFMKSGATRVDLTMLKHEFYRSLPEIKDRIFRRLVERKFYQRRPDTVRAQWLGIAFVVGFIIVFGGPVLGNSLGIAPAAAWASGIVSGLIIAGFGWLMPARTKGGARALEGILGFQEFLSRVESDRFERIEKTAVLFEKYLAYAMAFGVETQWAGAFEGIYKEPPNWYRGTMGGAMFHPALLTAQLGMMSHQTGQVLASAPRGKGGSGFGGGGGGGGFSGGGFGGGGGGGF